MKKSIISVVLVLTMVGAVVDGAADAGVGSTGHTAVGAILVHGDSSCKKFFGFRRWIFCAGNIKICRQADIPDGASACHECQSGLHPFAEKVFSAMSARERPME